MDHAPEDDAPADDALDHASTHGAPDDASTHHAPVHDELMHHPVHDQLMHDPVLHWNSSTGSCTGGSNESMQCSTGACAPVLHCID